MNARRFRFSIATHMAEESASLFHIAEVLDHTDTQNVRVYLETASYIADPVALATDDTLAPLVRRFQGRIINSDEHLTADGHSNRRIPAAVPHLGIQHLDVGGIGLCGRDADRDGLCQLLPPLSCYLCPSFAALRAGPHRQMLESVDKFLQQHELHSDRRISSATRSGAHGDPSGHRRNRCSGSEGSMSSSAVRKLTLIAREKFAADFGADPGMFDSSFWDISCFRDRAFNRTNRLHTLRHQRSTFAGGFLRSRQELVDSRPPLTRQHGPEAGLRAHPLGSDPRAARRRSCSLSMAGSVGRRPEPG